MVGDHKAKGEPGMKTYQRAAVAVQEVSGSTIKRQMVRVSNKIVFARKTSF